MLRSRKRTCRRSKSRCGGARQAYLAGHGGGSRSRRGGRGRATSTIALSA